VDPFVITTTVGGVLVVMAVLRRWTWSYARRTRRVLRKARVTRIAELVDGKLQCIVGTVELEGESLVALMSRRSCVAYETIVQVYARNQSVVPSHVEVNRRIVPFFVVDDSGRVRVDAAQAALSNRPTARGERFEERVIEPGMTVRLVGSVTLDPALDRAEHGFRDGGFTATITGTARFPLLVDVETKHP
jgi:hypothetical protein